MEVSSSSSSLLPLYCSLLLAVSCLCRTDLMAVNDWSGLVWSAHQHQLCPFVRSFVRSLGVSRGHSSSFSSSSCRYRSVTNPPLPPLLPAHINNNQHANTRPPALLLLLLRSFYYTVISRNFHAKKEGGWKRTSR